MRAGAAPEPMLVVEDLCVSFPNRDGGRTEAVRGVSFTLGRERLGIVGESGSGKTQTGRAILNYERAARLSPTDADIQTNLAVARGRVTDDIEAVSEVFFVK